MFNSVYNFFKNTKIAPLVRFLGILIFIISLSMSSTLAQAAGGDIPNPGGGNILDYSKCKIAPKYQNNTLNPNLGSTKTRKNLTELSKNTGIKVYTTNFLDINQLAIPYDRLSTKEDSTLLDNFAPKLVSELTEEYKIGKDGKWLKWTNLDGVILVKNMHSGSFNIFGTVQTKANTYDTDFCGNFIFMSINSDTDTNYTKRTIHHELFHIIQFTWWAKLNSFPDPYWNTFNDKNFHYGNIDIMYSSIRPAGFVTNYATTNVDEDEAETYGFIMNKGDNNNLEKWMKQEPALKNKVELLKKLQKQMPSDGKVKF